jgi:hypothetical protein
VWWSGPGAPGSASLARAVSWRPGRTNAGPMRAGVRVLTHPQGVRLDGHLLRGGAATRTVDHCTSPPFVPSNRTRCAGCVQEREGLLRCPGLMLDFGPEADGPILMPIGGITSRACRPGGPSARRRSSAWVPPSRASSLDMPTIGIKREGRRPAPQIKHQPGEPTHEPTGPRPADGPRRPTPLRRPAATPRRWPSRIAPGPRVPCRGWDRCRSAATSAPRPRHRASARSCGSSACWG